LNISINYEDIISQFKPWEGTNLWDDINYEDDKFLNGTNRPTVLYERLINLNKKNFTDLVVWDPFCGYGNSTLIFKKYGIKFYANEFDMKIHCKAMINTGTSINISKPIGCINW